MAIDELIRRHVPASVQTYGDVERTLYAIVQDYDEDSDGHRAARVVLQTWGALSRLVRACDVHDDH